MKRHSLFLDGNQLAIENVVSLARDPSFSVKITSSALASVDRAAEFLKQESSQKIIYGVNTGFGPMASYIVGKNQLVALQENLIRSHAVGMGQAVPEEYVLAAMVVRLNTLLKGFSGVSSQLIKHLQVFINKRIIPVIPEHGAVGTSGDLVQLAHIALALIGDGEVFYEGKRQETKKVMKQLGITPYKIRPKEGLSLINGTSMMSGIAALLCKEAERLISLSLRTGALSLELVHGFNDGISDRLHSLRPHHGQRIAARLLREILASSKLLRDRGKFQGTFEVTDSTHTIPEDVQEVYSLRCIPQVVGPALDILKKVRDEVSVEINSVTDNPIVDWKNKTFLHGGNFHGDYIAISMDHLKIAIAKLTMLSERRINFFLNQKINRFFPPFLNLKKPGLTLGLQGLQFVATSTTAQNQSFAFPHSIHSISTNADNQDIVSMGTDAALIAAKVIENAYIVFTIEMVVLSQAVNFLNGKAKLSKSSKELFDDVREILPVILDDRVIVAELASVVRYAKATSPLHLE